jgi:hypothetical protein
MSAWGEIVTIAQSEQANAPALFASASGSVTAVWVGADDAGIHHDMRVNRDEALVLPLPPGRPALQTLYPTNIDARVHLLWLDADYELRNDPLLANETYLFSALISAGTVERGPVRVSSGRTLHYAAAALPDGSLWAAWSGRLLTEPELYLQPIDNTGRPLQPQRIALNADFPTFARAEDGTLYLFWIQLGSRRVYRARVLQGSLQDTLAVTYVPTLNAGDRLVSISASMDRTHGYLFWNIGRVDGRAETWWASGTLTADEWALPQRLGITTADAAFTTGFNGGAGVTASAGETWQAWSAPLLGQHDAQPVAAWDGAQLGIVYLQAGSIVGYQAVVTVDILIGTPALLTDRNRHLYLSWAYPTPNAYANLLLTSTRR